MLKAEVIVLKHLFSYFPSSPQLNDINQNCCKGFWSEWTRCVPAAGLLYWEEGFEQSGSNPFDIRDMACNFCKKEIVDMCPQKKKLKHNFSYVRTEISPVNWSINGWRKKVCAYVPVCVGGASVIILTCGTTYTLASVAWRWKHENKQKH